MANSITRRRIILANTAWPSVTQLGTIATENFTTMVNLNNYITVNPTSTWAISGGYCNTVNAIGSNLGADYIRFNNYLGGSYTVLDRWTQTVNLYVRTISATSTGPHIGVVDLQSNGSDQYWGFLNCLTGLTGIVAIYYNGAAVASDLTIRTLLANDNIIMTMSRNYNTISLTVQNVTQAWTTTLNYTNNTMSSSAIGTPSMGQWALCNRGGTYDFASWTVSSTAQQNVDYCFIGHSIPAGYNATAESLAWPNIAMTGKNRTYTKLCSQSNYLGDMLNALPEILNINARTYVMMDARNDIALGVASGTWQANYMTFINNIKANGSRVLCPTAIPNNSPDVRPFNTYIAGIGETVVDIFNTALLNPPYSMVLHYGGDTTDDGTHPGPAGHAVIGNTFAPYII